MLQLDTSRGFIVFIGFLGCHQRAVIFGSFHNNKFLCVWLEGVQGLPVGRTSWGGRPVTRVREVFLFGFSSWEGGMLHIGDFGIHIQRGLSVAPAIGQRKPVELQSLEWVKPPTFLVSTFHLSICRRHLKPVRKYTG